MASGSQFIKPPCNITQMCFFYDFLRYVSQEYHSFHEKAQECVCKNGPSVFVYQSWQAVPSKGGPACQLISNYPTFPGAAAIFNTICKLVSKFHLYSTFDRGKTHSLKCFMQDNNIKIHDAIKYSK